jgi:aspartate aminotransferase
MNLSKRAIATPASSIRRIEPFAQAAREKGKKIYPLHIGQPDIETPKVFFDAVKNYGEKVLAYEPSGGDPRLIDGIISYYGKRGVSLERKNVLITNGGSEGLYFAIMALCDPGDELLLPEPFFPAYSTATAMVTVTPVPITTTVEDGYHLPPIAEIEKKITSRTRAIMLSHPGNPTGVIYTPKEVEDLAALARKHDFFIIADEVYREFVYEGIEYVSFADIDSIRDRLIVVDSISKRFSACGARIGCLVSHNTDVIASMLKFCQGRGSSPSIDQVGATALYSMDAASYLAEVNKEYSLRREELYAHLSSIPGVTCRKPEGAFYLMAKLPVPDAEQFVMWLLKDFDLDGETIMGAPGEGFYVTPGLGKSEMRLAYVLKRENLARAMHILKTALSSYALTSA